MEGHTAIFIGIVLHILGALISLAHIYRGCVSEDLPGDFQKNYYDQAGNCFKWGNAFIVFIWLVTSTATDRLISSALTIGIYSWALVLIISTICMIVKVFRRSEDPATTASLSRISTRSMRYLAFLIVIFWLIA